MILRELRLTAIFIVGLCFTCKLNKVMGVKSSIAKNRMYPLIILHFHLCLTLRANTILFNILSFLFEMPSNITLYYNKRIHYITLLIGR